MNSKELAEAIADHLNECRDLEGISIEEMIETLQENDKEEFPWLEFTTESGEKIDLTTFDFNENHVDGDGGLVCYWYDIDDDLGVGVTGIYSSWGGTEINDTFKVGKVQTYVERIFN